MSSCWDRDLVQGQRAQGLDSRLWLLQHLCDCSRQERQRTDADSLQPRCSRAACRCQCGWQSSNSHPDFTGEFHKESPFSSVSLILEPSPAFSVFACKPRELHHPYWQFCQLRAQWSLGETIPLSAAKAMVGRHP